MYSLRVLGGVALEGPGGPVSGRPAQRRELALLAILATASGQGVTRDKLIGCLWPDSEEDTARRSLSNALYVLRSELGDDVLHTAGDAVHLNRETVRSDVEDFQEAIARGDLEDAAAAYTGPLLDGFYAGAGRAFESWLDSERRRLALLYGEALESLAEGAEAENDPARATGWWQRLIAHDPYNSRAVLRLMQALMAAGDGANALQAAIDHEQLLRDELGLEPAQELLDLARQLREEQAAPADAKLAVDAPVRTRPAPDEPAAQPVPERPPRVLARRNMALGLAAAVGLAGAIAVGLMMLGERGVEPGGDRISIAVLPFENQSPNPGDDYFAEGVNAQIYTLLSKIAGLKVISRTSSMAYRDDARDVREIADALGVSYVIEGTAYREDDRTRITASLIDARTDESVWTEIYERDIGDVFTAQAEVAVEVAHALSAILTPDEIARVERRPTQNAQAYDIFLRAEAIRWRVERRLAIELYAQAVEVDPDFALAWARLAEARLNLMFYGEPIPLASAESALARAVELGPDLPATRMAQGWNAYIGDLDHEGAVDHFEAARRLEPSNIDPIESVGYIRLFQGRWDDGVAMLEEVADLDPLNTDRMWPLAGTYLWMRRYDDAIRFYERTLWRDPLYTPAHTHIALAHIKRDGDVESARRVLERATEFVDRPQLVAAIGSGGSISPLSPMGRILIDYYGEALRDTSSREYLREHNPDGYFVVQAELAARASLQDRARAYADSLVAHYEALTANPNEFGRGSTVLQLRLAWSLARAGRADEGIRFAERAAEEAPMSRDAWLGAEVLQTLAEVYVLTGEHEAALDQLEFLLSIPSDLSVALVRLDPLWDPLHDHPRFQAILDEYE